MRAYWLLMVGMAFGSMACNNSAKARLELHNLTGTAAAGLSGNSAGGLKLQSGGVTESPAEYLALKLSGVSLVPDVDPVTQNNIGEVAELWVAPGCSSADDCPFFNFARPTSEVNADLNSEQRDVTPGTYRYVRITFCYHGDTPTEPNIAWSGGNITRTQMLLEDRCGVTSGEYVPPITLQPGDSVGVELGYDLSGTIQTIDADPPGSGRVGNGYNGPQFDQCIFDSPTEQTCFRVPQFNPAAVTNGGGAGDTVGAGMGGDGGGNAVK